MADSKADSQAPGWAGVLAWLAFVEVVSYRLFSLGAGFYHDCWRLLELATENGGFWGGVRAMAGTQAVVRPVQLLIHAALYTVARPYPPLAQIWLGLLELAEGFLLYRLFARLTGSAGLALTAASFAMLYPNRSAVHVWPTLSHQLVAHVLLLASLLCHESWLKTRSRRVLLAGQAAYLLSCLTYESAIFLPLAFSACLWVRDGGRKIVRDMLPFAVSFSAVLLWQQLGAKVLLQAANARPPSPTLAHFLKVQLTGLESALNRTLHICAASLPTAISDFGPGLWLILAAFAAAVAWRLGRPADDSPGDGSARRRLLALSAAGFFFAYLPYALSSAYTPKVFGMMSRINGTGAWFAGGLLAWAFSFFPAERRRARAAALFAVTAAFTWTNWASYREYTASWRLQRDILRRAGAHLAEIAGPADILLTGVSSYVGHAVVFDAAHDFDSALRLTLGRKDLRGGVVSARLSFAAGGAEERHGGAVVARYPYDRLYLFDYGQDRFERLAGPPAPRQGT